jgi:hypothetical protein
MEPSELAPDEPVAAEPVMELSELAPDEPVAEEPVMELTELAPEEPVAEEPVMELAELAPEEPVAEEPVMELAELAPDEPVAAEPVMELSELAPDIAEAVVIEELITDTDVLAPDGAGLDPSDLPMGLADPDLEALMPGEPIFQDEVEVLDHAPIEIDVPPTSPEEHVFDVAMLAPLEPAAWTAIDDDLDAGDEPDTTPMVTRTMAELFVRQGLTDRALEIYRQLLGQRPDDPELIRRVRELSPEAADEPAPAAPSSHEQDDAGDHHWTQGAGAEGDEVDTPFAWTATDEAVVEPAPGPGVTEYFRRMLSWEPGRSAEQDGTESTEDA